MASTQDKVEVAGSDKKTDENMRPILKTESMVATEVIEVDAAYLSSSSTTKFYRGVLFQMILYVSHNPSYLGQDISR